MWRNWIILTMVAFKSLVADNYAKNDQLPRSKSIPSCVYLEIYYETLCPDSVDFIVNQLKPAVDKLGTKLVRVDLIPFGIASEEKVGEIYTFRCQHGPRECKGNTIQSCAIQNLKNSTTTTPLDFVTCMQRSRDPSSAGALCAVELGVNYKPIAECSTTLLGNQLQHRMAQRTFALKPKLTWVPWIVLNGLHTDGIQQRGSRDLLGLVCDTLQGTKPANCSQARQLPS